MEGNPHEAASAIFNARERLYGAMMELMGQGDLPAAYTAVREAQVFLETVRDELEGLARVNGVARELDALGDGTEPEPPRRDGFCSDNAPCINSCASGPCSRRCRVCLRLDGTNLNTSPPCPSCGDYPLYAAKYLTERPPPDPDRKPAATLLSNASLASFAPEVPPGISSSDLRTDLVPWSEHGAMLTGVDQSVRVTHVPTGVAVISSAERSQLQNKARALAMLSTHPDVERYVRDQRCTHGADCKVHGAAGALHDFDGVRAEELPVHPMPQHRRDPR